MTAALLDHLWQSTLFATVIWLIMPLFRSNSAAVRFWLWFTASMKFLVPLSIFTIAGRHLLAPVAPSVPARFVSAFQPVAIPFSVDTPVRMAAQHLMLIDVAAAAWIAGGAAVLVLWLLRSLRLGAQLRGAALLPMAAAVPVKSARSMLEPGLVGIWRPVILLPQGIAENLSPTEMEAVMAHELCHLRRRDNLLAALHMLVEALFWFHPLVWWLGSRLVEEREHACDEGVLAAGNQPLVYAQGILKVCRFYIQSPLACASGVSGAALETRVGTILRNRPIDDVQGAKSALLISVAALSVIVPLLAGVMQSGPVSLVASRVATAIAAQTAQLPAATLPVQLKIPSHRARRHAAFIAPAIEAIIPQDTKITAGALPAIPQTDTAPADVSASAQAVPDDSAILVCRSPQPLPASRFSGPRVCLLKSRWEELRAQGKDVSADGRAIVTADWEKSRSLHPQSCNHATTPIGATNGNMAGFGCF